MIHSSIIPLIGGSAIASQHVFGTLPEWVASYTPFASNEQHLLNYWDRAVPYHVLDAGGASAWRSHKQPTVVDTICPCAGLSFLSTAYSSDNEINNWMMTTAQFVLGEVKPVCFWGENSPNLATNVGKKFRDKLVHLAAENGYSTSFYWTKSLMHGVPQVRRRVFYFFWRGNKVPLLNYYDRPWVKIEDLIAGIRSNTLRESYNKNVPSQEPYYRYLLEEVHGGISHKEFFQSHARPSVRDNDAKSWIEKAGHSYIKVGDWMRDKGFEKEYDKCQRMHTKLASGGNIMRRGTTVPKDYIGAFVGHYPRMLTHPTDDRYISYREAMSIMGLPESMELIDPSKNINHVCQNVPVGTATDIAFEVRAALLGNRTFVPSRLLFQHNQYQRHYNGEVEWANKKETDDEGLPPSLSAFDEFLSA